MRPLPRPSRYQNVDDRRSERALLALVVVWYLIVLAIVGVAIWAAVRFTLAYT